MSLFDYVDPFVFLVALCVGLLYTYVSAPPQTVVIKYPTPFNAGKITYVDDAGVCYRYAVKETKCPAKGLVKQVPVQETHPSFPQPTPAQKSIIKSKEKK